ncbi:MAG: hypothetical protein JSV86_10560 [Gemmatimonadota bacterium]|nr:MAG: hypothetical protein JSV86_10560 [Gemmatimonadota bacterium]
MFDKVAWSVPGDADADLAQLHRAVEHLEARFSLLRLCDDLPELTLHIGGRDLLRLTLREALAHQLGSLARDVADGRVLIAQAMNLGQILRAQCQFLLAYLCPVVLTSQVAVVEVGAIPATSAALDGSFGSLDHLLIRHTYLAVSKAITLYSNGHGIDKGKLKVLARCRSCDA